MFIYVLFMFFQVINDVFSCLFNWKACKPVWLGFQNSERGCAKFIEVCLLLPASVPCSGMTTGTGCIQYCNLDALKSLWIEQNIFGFTNASKMSTGYLWLKIQIPLLWIPGATHIKQTSKTQNFKYIIHPVVNPNIHDYSRHCKSNQLNWITIELNSWMA